MNKYTKDQIVVALCDCFGYSYDEFKGVRRATIVRCISDKQKKEIMEYLK